MWRAGLCCIAIATRHRKLVFASRIPAKPPYRNFLPQEPIFNSVLLENVSFSYPGAENPILNGVSLTIPTGWSGVIGRNGCGKTTLLQLVTGQLVPTSGICKVPGRISMCEQRTDDPPARFHEFIADITRDAWRLKVALGVDESYLERWHQLSFGERKRSQIAVALWEEPLVLLLDEPTNHLDKDSRATLAQALRRFKGIGILVSHDRELLNELCDRCICFENGSIVTRPGNFDRARDTRAQERATQAHRAEEADRLVKRLSSELQRRREAAARAKKKNSKRNISPKDHDAKERIDRARVTGKDAKLSNALRRITRRVEEAERHAREIRPTKELAVGVAFTCVRQSQTSIISLAPGVVGLSPGRELRYSSVCVSSRSRVGISGSNGAGKSSFLAHVIQTSGVLVRGGFYLPQEITEDEGIALRKRLAQLDSTQLGRILGIVGRLGSDPKALRTTLCPSPGEVRKLLIAEALSRSAPILILDEPTNHLDLEAAMCLEEALRHYEGALLIISHDEHLLGALTDERWVVTSDGEVVTLV